MTQTIKDLCERAGLSEMYPALANLSAAAATDRLIAAMAARSAAADKAAATVEAAKATSADMAALGKAYWRDRANTHTR